MKILITNNHLNTFGGTENWVWTVYSKLKLLGHDVDVFTFNAGDTDATKRFDNVFVNLRYNSQYDLILCNHQSCLNYLILRNVGGYIKFISHGVVPPLEQPVFGANEYIAISEEVQKNLKSKGFDSKIIYNPVDLDELYPEKELRDAPETMFSLCQSQKAVDQLRIHFPALDIRSLPTSREKRVKVIRMHYNDADVCVGLGRSAMESLACGRPTLIYDWRHYMGEKCDGSVDQNNINDLLKNNLSGRRYSTAPLDINNYVPHTDYYRSIAEDYFDADKIVKQLCE